MKTEITSAKYLEMLRLQEQINKELLEYFELHKEFGSIHLPEKLISKVESIVENLNKSGYQFSPCDYGGDVNYLNSEQTYSDGQEIGSGVTIHFHGFSAQVSWRG